MKTEPATPSQMADWATEARSITADSPRRSEPTKPSKPSFAGFVGLLPADPPKIGAVETIDLPGQSAGESHPSHGDSSTATERVMSWAEWKARALNRLFLEQGISGQAGRITAETILNGEQNEPRTTKATSRPEGSGAKQQWAVYKRGRVWWYRFTWKAEAIRRAPSSPTNASPNRS